jgi:predicted RND superfamily exporter protein
MAQPSRIFRLFTRILQMRGAIVIAFVILTIAGIYGTTRIPNDPAIDRLVISGDPTARATLEFDHLFPEGDQALIMLEGADPLSPAALRITDQLEQQLRKIPGVKPHSLIDLFRRGAAVADISASGA